ncbi:MAG: four helix bundle protein [Symploca sp. SIO2E6]|nr:four helix bundle protein [Symploca sp. SIO2E6]
MGNIRSFKELRVWQNAIDVAMKIFEVTKSFPVEERFSLTDQIRRSSRSVAANITEAWSREDAGTRRHGDAGNKQVRSHRVTASPTLRVFFSEEVLAQIVAMINHPEKWTIRSNSSVSRS